MGAYYFYRNYRYPFMSPVAPSRVTFLYSLRHTCFCQIFHVSRSFIALLAVYLVSDVSLTLSRPADNLLDLSSERQFFR